MSMLQLDSSLRRLDAGWYETRDGHFTIVRSLDDRRQWVLEPNSDEAWEALGCPERASGFDSKGEAVQMMQAIYREVLS